ncbi:MAG: glycosyltransferase [Sphingobacteriales bacterium]|nr:MAG: glycosyltransferase [Sphingobacteriales bacterium]
MICSRCSTFIALENRTSLCCGTDVKRNCQLRGICVLLNKMVAMCIWCFYISTCGSAVDACPSSSRKHTPQGLIMRKFLTFFALLASLSAPYPMLGATEKKPSAMAAGAEAGKKADKPARPLPFQATVFRVNKTSNKFRFLHVSTMGPEKQPFMLLRAFDSLIQSNEIGDANAELVCVGTVPENLEKWVNQNIRKKAQIVFRGNVPYPQVAEEMRNADCLLITSLYETFSCVAVEALLSGLPVIATPVGVIPELVTPENGLIVKNEDELLAAMKQVIASHNAYRPHTIASGQKGRFSYQTIGAKLFELYDNV